MDIKELSLKEIKELTKEDRLLSFNRDIQPRHVNKMIQSVNECGILRLPVIGDISAFDKRKRVIIDGQHLCVGITKLDKNNQMSKVKCLLKVYKEKSEVIADIAKLNNTQKTWNDEDYLYAWYKFGRDNVDHYINYSELYNTYQNFEGIPCSFMVDLFAKSKDDFKEGKLEFRDKDFSTKILQICYKLRESFNKPAHTLHGLRMWAVERVFVEKREIDYVKLESRLFDALRTSKDNEFNGRDDFREFIQRIYTKI